MAQAREPQRNMNSQQEEYEKPFASQSLPTARGFVRGSSHCFYELVEHFQANNVVISANYSSRYVIKCYYNDCRLYGLLEKKNVGMETLSH